MEKSFILSCESTVDMPFSYVNGRDISVLFYSYTVDGKSYTDDMLRNPDAMPQFYRFIEGGSLPSTSQLNVFDYESFFDSLLQKGDVLHLAFGTGMTKSFYNAEIAAEGMRKKYPDRKLTVIDTLCSSSGYGMLVDYAADLRDSGGSVEDTVKLVMAYRKRIHHQFFSTRVDFFKRSGRVSWSMAAIATLLGICPIMRLDADGKIIAYGKVRGIKNAIKTTVDTMAQHAESGTEYSGKCFICHSECIQLAEETKDAVEARFPQLSGKIRIFDIGTIVASHSGPGTVAVFFVGDERK